jgi:hypothetical protein
MGACNFRSTVRFSLMAISCLVLSCTSQQEFGLIPSQEVTETSLTYNNEVDLLFVVDTSATMSAHQVDLSEQTPFFLDALIGTKLDFRIAITTMDMRTQAEKGRFVGVPKVLTNSTPNLVNVLQDRLAIMGENGGSVEMGRAAMLTAIQREADLYPASEFFRPDALLVIVFLTNEDDASDDSVNYIQILDELKPPLPSGERSWVAHFIGVVPGVSHCELWEGQYAAGYKYMELAEASGGVVENICSADLRAAVNSVKSRVIQYITDIRLDRIPDVDTIQVKVNGVVVPKSSVNGWSYVEEFNLIRFHGSAIPKADAVVVVDYDPAGIKE